MDFSIPIDFWLLVSLCLAFTIIGLILGVRVTAGARSERHRY